MLALPQAQTKHRQSLDNWVNGNKPLVRSESTCFVGSLEDEDYVALRPDEPDTAGLEALLEMSLKAFPKLSKNVSHSQTILVAFQLTLKLQISSSQVRLCYPHWMFTS